MFVIHTPGKGLIVIFFKKLQHINNKANNPIKNGQKSWILLKKDKQPINLFKVLKIINH